MYKHETLGPAITLYKDVIDDPQSIIDLALSEPFWRSSQLWEQRTNSFNSNINRRNTEIFDLPQELKIGSLWHSLAQNIFNRVDHYAQSYSFPFMGMEGIQILRYGQGQGFYEPHFDDGPPMNRVCSSVLYLNDVEEGGETHFINFGLSVKPVAGNMIVFPANYAYIHKANSPISGEKFSAVTWFGR